MLARKKTKSLKNSDSPAPTPPKISISPSSSSANFGFAVKREDKPGVSRTGRKSIGFTPKEERPLENNDVLGGIIPGMKGTLFSQEVSNIQRARELKRLVGCLGDWGTINDTVMLKLVQSIKENVEALDEKLTPLVTQILDGDWCNRSSKVVKAFEDFIAELFVIRPCYSGVVLQSLVKKLLPQSGDNFNSDSITKEDKKVFEVVHRNLFKLLEAFPIPRMRESCIKTMGAIYPYMGRSAYMHYCYVHNIIKTMDYAPHLSCQILQLCIHKLCRIDVNIPRGDCERFSNVLSEAVLAEHVKSESGERIPVSLNLKEAINSTVLHSDINPLANILDLCLSLVFESLETILNEHNQIETLFDTILLTFESEVLPTFGVNNVQFLYFYFVSAQLSFTQKFLEFLWKKATNVNTPDVIRMQCMSYISGVLTRSSVVTVKILKRWLSRMADWANMYVDQRVKNSHWSSVNVQLHGAFYAVCQCIFYVFAFRNKDLIGSRKCTAFTSTLNLGRLVTCDLNPLKAVIPPVAIAFVKAAHTHQISYCQTVLERNQRATIPTSVRDSLHISAMDSVGPVSNILESFFPFDPFYLPRSKKWIEPIYRVYEVYLPELKLEKCDSPLRTDRFSDQNEDSIDMELSTSFQDQDSNFMARFLDTSESMEI